MPKKQKSDEEYLDMAQSVSANETTGAMPTLPRTKEEYEALQDLAGISTPRGRRRRY